MKVEFIYDSNCPNIADTRTQLMKAFSEAKLPAKWSEWDRNSPDSPSYAKQYGSPTILVDGNDIANNKPTKDNHCRIYQGENQQLMKTPSLSLLIEAFNAAREQKSISSGNDRGNKQFSWQNVIAILPSVFVALLPKLTCPLCWPLYAGILSSFGIAFVNYTPYLFPLTAIFLFISLFTFWFRSKRRRGYYPLILGIVASLIMLIGKFTFDYDWALYVGIGLLVLASIWNGWPVKNGKACTKCK